MSDKNNKPSFFVNKSQLAERYNICVKTLNKYIARVESKLPLYNRGDSFFTPAQVKVLDRYLIHVEE